MARSSGGGSGNKLVVKGRISRLRYVTVRSLVTYRLLSRNMKPCSEMLLKVTVGSLRSAIGLLAADVGTMGGQGGGPRRGARRHNA